jgi:hypothetical protein
MAATGFRSGLLKARQMAIYHRVRDVNISIDNDVQDVNIAASVVFWVD